MTLKETLERSAQKNGEKILMKFKRDGAWQTLTYGQFLAMVRNVAEVLVRTCHVRPGDRVALMGANSPEWCAIHYAITGIAATAIFCLIFAWNEYAFALLLTSGEAQTAPPFIPTIIGVGGQDWPAVAAGATLFLLPVMIFTILLRKHLLRGITFGAVRK